MTEMNRERIIRVLTDNIKVYAKKMQGSVDVLLYNLDEIARFLAYGCDGKEDFEQNYRALRDEIFTLDSTVIGEKATLFAHLFKRICFYLDQKGIRLRLCDFFEAESITENKVTYVKSPLSDEAYRVFSRVLDRPAVTYAVNFVSACEDVYYGRVPFCILPYENTEEGNLTGFMRLIRKYELYPHLVCSCRGENGVTKLVLLGRSPCSAIRENLKMTVRASFYGASGRVVSDVILAASEMGLALVKTESEPISWDEGRYGEIISFATEDIKGVYVFLMYLSLEVPECSDKSVFYEISARELNKDVLRK